MSAPGSGIAFPVVLELGDPRSPALCWHLDEPRHAISTAAVGGGIGLRRWVLNAQVPRDYARTDLDRHVEALASEAGCTGAGIGLLTAARVERYSSASDEDVVAFVTLGIETPTWAAAAPDRRAAPAVGTINVVVFVGTALGDAAMVNAVATATEAKVQALFEHGVAGTGTPTDAVCVLTPAASAVPADRRAAEPFAGSRSRVGAAMARAVHRAVADGLRAGDPPRGGS